MVLWAPLFEEFLKTFAALFIKGSLLFSHLAFGIVECIFDFVRDGKRKMNVAAAIFAVFSHMSFGIIVYITVKMGYSIFAGYFLSSLVHLLWNLFVYKMKI